MSTSKTLPAGTGLPGLPGLRLRGLAWLVWRQQRAALWTGVGLVAVVACYVLLQLHGQDAYVHRHHIEGCQVEQSCHDSSAREATAYSAALQHVDHVYRVRVAETGRLLIALPVLVGVFLGAPLFAREWETGTHQLVWSQSVSRTRWLAAKLTLPAVGVLLGSTVLAALYAAWWWPRRGKYANVTWYSQVPFHATGPSLVGLSVLSFFVGAAVGLVLRRTLPAMAVSLAVTVGVQLGLNKLRSHVVHLMPLRTLVVHGGDAQEETPHGAWWRESGYLTRSGQKVPYERCMTGAGEGTWRRCLARLDVPAKPATYAEYHPEGQLWPAEWVEAGICLAATVVLVVFCAWWFRRRASRCGAMS